jgi:hypothetical protein
LETCDGLDNDCDGSVDEGLAIAAPHVHAATGPLYQPVIVGLPGGFGVLAAGSGLSGSGRVSWVSLDLAGVAGAPMMVGSAYASSVSAAVDGSTVVALADYQSFMPGMPLFVSDELFSFDAGSGQWVSPSSGMPYTFSMPSPTGFVRLTAVGGGHASAYASYGTAAPYQLHRYRVAMGSTPSIIASFDTGVALTQPSVDAIVAHGVEHTAVLQAGGAYLLETAEGDPATSSTVLGPISGLASDLQWSALAVEDSVSDVTATNPIAAVFSRASPNGIVVVLIQGVAPLTTANASALPSSAGGRVAIAAAPGPGAPRFYVAAMDDAGSSRETLHLWEVTSAPPSARQISVTDDWVASRGPVAFAVSGGVVRLVEDDGMSNLVTRSIGCR